MQRPLRDKTQHSQQTDIRASEGIRTRNPSKRAAADPRTRPRGHRDRQVPPYLQIFFSPLYFLTHSYRSIKIVQSVSLDRNKKSHRLCKMWLYTSWRRMENGGVALVTHYLGKMMEVSGQLHVPATLPLEPADGKLGGPQSLFRHFGMIWYDMIYLLTAIWLSPGGSSTVHIYTQTIHRTLQNKQYIEQHNNFGRVRAVPRLGYYTLAYALQLRKKHGKTSVRVAASKNT